MTQMLRTFGGPWRIPTAPHGPLPRLRGRDREGAATNSEPAASPSPTLPRERGREFADAVATFQPADAESICIRSHA